MADLPKRKRNRIKDFDYSSNNAYFITVCTKGRKCVLAKIAVGNDAHIVPTPELTSYGIVAEKYIRSISGIDKYVIMPNHIHMIILKTDGKTSISSDIRSMKVLVTKEIGTTIWQKSFYDHIIRSEKDYLSIWEYIENNPAKWAEDEYYQL